MNQVMLQAFSDEFEKIAAGKVGPFFRRQWHGLVGGSALKPGEYSLPGRLKEFAKSPTGDVKKGWGEMSPFDKAMATGFAGMEVPDAVAGVGKAERGKALGRVAGGLLGWPILRKVPLLGAIPGWMLASWTGGKAGQLVGRGLGG